MNQTSQQPQSIVGELETFFSRFLALSPGLPLVLALWSLATHLHERFDAFPYLAVTSPTKRCGKTRVCELVGFVCFQPLPTVSISAAALYRLLGKGKRTLLIDEAEYLGRKNDDRASTLREILNAGYRKGQVVYRCKKTSKTKGKSETHESFEPESFETFCPKALVLIGRLQDTLADRCIEARMERRTNARIERFRFARVKAETAPLREAAELWAASNGATVESHYQNNDLPYLQDREAELWLPLFSTCAVAASHRLSDLETVARRLADVKSEDEPRDAGIELLRDVRGVFQSGGVDRLSTFDILGRLNSSDGPWAGWFHGRGLNAHTLARQLRPFNVYPRDIRFAEGTQKGYLSVDFEAPWTRYLPSETEEGNRGDKQLLTRVRPSLAKGNTPVCCTRKN